MNSDWVEELDAIESDDKCLLFEDKYISHIEGKILTLIEGLIEINSPKRQNAIKSLVSEAIWGDMHNGWATPVDKEVFEELSM